MYPTPQMGTKNDWNKGNGSTIPAYDCTTTASSSPNTIMMFSRSHQGCHNCFGLEVHEMQIHKGATLLEYLSKNLF